MYAPIACTRARSCVNITPISARDAGISAEPATPITDRAPITMSGVVANAPTAEARAKTRAQATMTRRLPYRSATAPMVSMAPATRKL